jgi:DNA-binding transcriptional MerR regulator
VSTFLDAMAARSVNEPAERPSVNEAEGDGDLAAPKSEALTIDDLAALTRVPSRTIRFYQAKGLLPAPKLVGRVAFYEEAHRERLKLIAQLQDRGLKIDAIRELVRRIDRGEVDVSEWLGVQASLRAPWVADHARTCTEEELFELAQNRRDGLLADLVRAGLVQRQGELFLVASPSMVAVVGRLDDAGVPVASSMGAEKVLRKYIGKAVSELVGHFLTQIEKGQIDPRDGGTELLPLLRPMGLDAVRIIFGQEMERTLREHVESGKTTTSVLRRKS